MSDVICAALAAVLNAGAPAGMHMFDYLYFPQLKTGRWKAVRNWGRSVGAPPAELIKVLVPLYCLGNHYDLAIGDAVARTWT